MEIKVCKFGGTSCADAGNIIKTAQIIKGDDSRRLVVVSAPGKRHTGDTKVTDLLYAAANAADLCQALAPIKQRFLSIVEELGVRLDIQSEFEQIEAEYKRCAGVDYLVSRGEYLAAKILAQVLGYEFVDASDIIKFNSNQKLDEELTAELIFERLTDKRAVIGGFYGSTEDGKIKTLGRGGSDVSGALVAHGVRASVYENWTDVSGFRVCDPRIVPNSPKIEILTYRELRELSYMGANVLHPESIFPVRKADIPINIKNTFQPEDNGTMIVPTKRYLRNEFGRNERMITGIAGKKDFISINIVKAMINNEAGVVAKLLSALMPYNISFEHLPTGIDTISLVIDSHNMDINCLPAVVEQIELLIKPDHLEVDRNLALIAIVGHEMIRRKGCAAKIFAEVARADINVKMIDVGSSEMNIIIGVENCDFEKAIRAIYSLF